MIAHLIHIAGGHDIDADKFNARVQAMRKWIFWHILQYNGGSLLAERILQSASNHQHTQDLIGTTFRGERDQGLMDRCEGSGLSSPGQSSVALSGAVGDRAASPRLETNTEQNESKERRSKRLRTAGEVGNTVLSSNMACEVVNSGPLANELTEALQPGDLPGVDSISPQALCQEFDDVSLRAHAITLNVGPIGLRESLTNLLPLFKTNPALVLLQERNLSLSSLEQVRQITHRLLPHYCLFAGRPPRSNERRSKVQVVTLVHVSLAARASLLDVAQQSVELVRVDAEALSRVHFLRLIDPRSGVTFLVANVYQYQADQLTRQSALLSFIREVIGRWQDLSDHIVVGGDFNASIQPRFGYSERSITAQADELLQAWVLQTNLTFASTTSATWFSGDDSHRAVLDGFFSRRKLGGVSADNPVVSASPDPRHDHRLVLVTLGADQIEAMPPLESLRRPRPLGLVE